MEFPDLVQCIFLKLLNYELEKTIIRNRKGFCFHKKRDWKPAIALVNDLLTEYPDDVDQSIRAIYLLHNILVEDEYPNEELGRMIDLLQKWFNHVSVP